jgi:MiaB/RimO family radical SAM methylthiotransferase
MEPTFSRSRVLVTGCWATSDQTSAQAIPGVSAVLGHHQNMAMELDRLITAWQLEDARPAKDLRLVPLDEPPSAYEAKDILTASGPVPMDDEKDNKWMIQAGAPAGLRTTGIKPSAALQVNQNLVESARFSIGLADLPGTTSLPVLSTHQTGLQRAVLKVQDGCDAHCTYCIIPQLRPRLWSKPIDQAVEEAKALVAAGHCEIVLTGIFLGAYGQATALRRRQGASDTSLAHLVEALCTRVTGLRRLRLSSIEPGDLTADLLAVLSSHHQVMPHFHLPLQSGSDLILRRMNRQYSRDDFLRMVERVRKAFDRPALTTDVVVGFPGEDDAEFEQTVDLVKAAGFIHVHAFPYSPRPGTAAARWTDQFVHGPVVGERLHRLQEISLDQSLLFRRQFLDQEVEIVVERERPGDSTEVQGRHGRCERYFDVWLDESAPLRTGQVARVRITNVTSQRTFARCV